MFNWNHQQTLHTSSKPSPKIKAEQKLFLCLCHSFLVVLPSVSMLLSDKCRLFVISSLLYFTQFNFLITPKHANARWLGLSETLNWPYCWYECQCKWLFVYIRDCSMQLFHVLYRYCNMEYLPIPIPIQYFFSSNMLRAVVAGLLVSLFTACR